MTLVRWEDPDRRVLWFMLEEFPNVRIGLTDHALVAARDPVRVALQALEVLRDELKGQAGDRVLTKGDVRALALLPAMTANNGGSNG